MRRPKHSGDYRARLTSPCWRKLRARILKQRGRQCERCGKTWGEMHLHHKTYERLWQEADEDLEILCVGCHGDEHGRRAYQRQAQREDEQHEKHLRKRRRASDRRMRKKYTVGRGVQWHYREENA